MKSFYQKIIVLVLLIAVSGFGATSIKAQVLFNEGFNTAVPLPAGWASQNLSAPVGTQAGWFQGNATVFPANSGATTAYIAANFNNVGGANIISNWLFTPSVTLKNGDIFTFYTRTVDAPAFPDRMQVRLSTNGASTNAGATSTSVGDFSTLLLDINPAYTLTDYPNVWTQYTIVISGLGGPTPGRIAFRYFVEDGGPAGNNSDFIGIDDVVYTTFGAGCSGTPNPGNTISSAASVCPGINFNLSLQNNPPVSGLTYQWQSSPDGTTWTNIASATLSTLTTNQIAATYYRCNVTCSGNTGPSNPVQVNMNAPNVCYCPAGSTDVDPTFEKISNVLFGTINNASTSAVGYEDFTTLTPVASFAAGLNVPITVTGSNTYGGDRVRVWIDFNQNGDFGDPGELVYTSAQNAGPYAGIVSIPVTASIGNTRMRIRLYDNIFGNGNTTPCGNNTYGQVEDYTIKITPCIPGIINTQPADVTSYCSGNASLTVAAAGTGLTYQWQESSDGGTTWTIVANGGIYSGATTATLTLTDLLPASNGHQFQVAVGGPCTPLVLSSVATLTVGPLVASVNPTSATLCNGSIQQLSLTATAPPATLTIASGPISVLVPDATPSGASHTITTNAVPAGAIVTGLKVKFTLPHTWPGDINVVLKAPNGKIINLDYFLSATGAGPGTGFVNTAFSSQTSPVLPLVGSGSNPYTGTFRPDAVVTPAAGNPPAGPTAFPPNTAVFSDLFGTPNGSWTLAAYDGFGGDEGSITSWSLDITYGAPFSGIWTGTPLYTDAAATIPYVPGTLANTVYANPTTSTDYSVSISTANCTSDPTIIPITVANPMGTITAPTDKAICVNNNTSFSVSAASGNPIDYQWQESTDGGTTWNDLSDGGVYSGTNTSTLDLTNVPIGYSTYKYRAVLTVAACGSTGISGAATLTVNPLPTIALAAAPYTKLYPGLTTKISSTVSPTAATYQWYRNGILVPGEVASSINVDVDGMGDYTLAVTDVNGCSNISGALTISEAANDILFIYPSPNTGQFQVRYYNLAGNSINPRTLTIYDSKGSRVYSRIYDITLPYSRMDVDMSNYSKGVYRVELGDRNGKRIKTGSVIIL